MSLLRYHCAMGPMHFILPDTFIPRNPLPNKNSSLNIGPVAAPEILHSHMAADLAELFIKLAALLHKREQLRLPLCTRSLGSQVSKASL